jgi:class 3 adenylate cyclase
VTPEEAPGGTVGCDVCGILLAADKVAAHRAWHRKEEERLDRLVRLVQEVLDQLRRTHS